MSKHGKRGALTVVGFQGRNVSDAGVANQQVYAYAAPSDGGAGVWTPTTPGGWVNSTLGGNGTGTCDFATQTTQTLSSDGNYTLCGVVMVKVNSANETTHAQITNGTGMTLTPVSSTQFYTSARTAPMVDIPFVNVNPGYTVSQPVEICAAWASQNPAANFDEAFVGVDSGGTVGWRAGIAYNGGLVQQLSGFIGTSGLPVETATVGTSDVVECLTLVGGVVMEEGILTSSSTAYSGGVWPDSAMVVRGTVLSGSYGAGSTAFPAMSAYAAAVGAQRQGSGTTFAPVLRAERIRFQW